MKTGNMISPKIKIAILLTLCWIALVSKSGYASDISRAFTTLSIQEARQTASLQGKLIFLDFHAKWCSPCNWMDKTTFNDEQVISILQKDYVAIKIDIDQKEGYEIKNQFDVQYLPTLLIFNSEGIMVERVEKTITPRALKELLEKHNEPNNKKVIKHTVNSAPALAIPTTNPEKSKVEMKMDDEEQKMYDTTPVNQKVYKLQVGVFEKYESADGFVQKLNSLFTEPVTVKNEFVNGKMVFKIFLGQFDTMEEALAFKKSISVQNNMDSFVL